MTPSASSATLGLRPLWRLETPDDYIFSSEPGAASATAAIPEQAAAGAGEKFIVTIDAAKRRSRLWEHAEMQREVARRWLERTGAEGAAAYDRALETGARSRAPTSPATRPPAPRSQWS